MELNKGLTMTIDKVLIVKERGILYASPVFKQLMIEDTKEG